MAQRPIASVPRPVLAALALALASQLAWHAAQPAPQARAAALPPAPPAAALQLASLGEQVALSKLLTLFVQSHDDQAGVRIAWRELDYVRVRGWLARALALDPRGQYPLMLASEVYGAVADPLRQRLMLDFVYQEFARDPNRRWPWLAHAALVARHRLHDLPLARQYARAIRLQAPSAPPWARELEAFVLEDMNEMDAARAVIGGLISSGQVSDPHELRFLEQRLEQMRP